jgi:ribonuclease BN (tRNA processing enzyme)
MPTPSCSAVGACSGIFITHLHSDHVSEVPGVLLYNWGPPVQGFTEPFEIVGPGRAGQLPLGYPAAINPPTPGTEDMVRDLLRAYAYDINIRVTDEARPPLDDLALGRDIELPRDVRADARRNLVPDMEPFVIFEDERVRVLAALVEHPPVFPSYGFRFETAAGVVALSGDTAEHDNVVRLARDADLLVHEAVYLPYYRERGLSEEFINHLAISHTEPAGVGRVAAAAGVGALVLSHLAGVATDEQWLAGVREHYAGPAEVASDGQVFPM